MPRIEEEVVEIPRKVVKYGISDIAGFLQETLGPKLVAYMVNATDLGVVSQWAEAGSSPPSFDQEQRLLAIFQIIQLLQQEESLHTVRAWMIGLNPQLLDISPAAAIREGRIRDVLAAARSYVSGG